MPANSLVHAKRPETCNKHTATAIERLAEGQQRY
jgi:hypothetical protein